MRMIVTRVLLTLSGLILGCIGSALLLAPVSFLTMSEISVEPDPSLLSEIAAPAGILLIGGGFMIFGAANLRFSDPALAIGALVFGSYGAGRTVAMALHGYPSPSLITATLIELAIAAALAGLRLASTGRHRSATVALGT